MLSAKWRQFCLGLYVLIPTTAKVEQKSDLELSLSRVKYMAFFVNVLEKMALLQANCIY